jgi:hypothetical protein
MPLPSKGPPSVAHRYSFPGPLVRWSNNNINILIWLLSLQGGRTYETCMHLVAHPHSIGVRLQLANFKKKYKKKKEADWLFYLIRRVKLVMQTPHRRIRLAGIVHRVWVFKLGVDGSSKNSILILQSDSVLLIKEWFDKDRI